MKENLGITCMEKYSKTRKAWWVRLGYTKINGKTRPWFHKLFAYDDYGGKQQAKKVAIEWRDARLKELKTPVFRSILRQDHFYTGNATNNKWNKTGIHITECQYTDSSGRYRNVWEAVATICSNKKKYWFSRSCWKYGQEEAIKLCIEWRVKKEIELSQKLSQKLN